MFTYINHNVKGFYVTLETQLDSESYNNIGSTWEDFIAGKWVLLNNDQVEFHQANPSAKISEVWAMELDPVHVRNIEDAKIEMLGKIDAYDKSNDVNGFTINGMIEGWFNPSERTNYKSSIDAAKLLGLDKLSFYVGDVMLDIAPSMAEGLLSQIQLYADQCFIVTKQHKLAVEALQTIEDVDAYDYKSGYPGKLNFNLD